MYRNISLALSRAVGFCPHHHNIAMTSNETQVYKANCHCGQVKMSVILPNLLTTRVNRCNCSICTRNGYLLVYPKREHVSFLCGEDKLSAYRFGNRRKPHMFCPTCGTSMFIDFRESDREDERDEIGFNVG
jgi:hypothetical protein